MAEYKVIGIDLAKRNFHVVGLDGDHKVTLKKKVSREEFFSGFLPLFTKKQTFAMEACGGCHVAAQKIQEQGHAVILLKPKDVKPYAKSKQKNDINDAIAICKASFDPELMTVQPKTPKQQEISFLHKTRQNVIQQRIQRSNALISSLMEFGFIIECGKARFAKECQDHVKAALKENFIRPIVFDQMILDCKEIAALLEREKSINQMIVQENKDSKEARLLETIPGIGPINASILSIKSMALYKTPKDFAASLGLVPKQSTTGGTIRLGSITKQGDRYARTMLIQAARSLVMPTYKGNVPQGALYQFVARLKENGKHYNVTCVAVANKLARVAYACVTKGIVYDQAS